MDEFKRIHIPSITIEMIIGEQSIGDLYWPVECDQRMTDARGTDHAVINIAAIQNKIEECNDSVKIYIGSVCRVEHVLHLAVSRTT